MANSKYVAKEKGAMYTGKPSKGVVQPGDGGMPSGKANPFNDLGNSRPQPPSESVHNRKLDTIKKTPDMTKKSGGLGRKKK